MVVLTGFAWLLALQVLGEGLSRALSLPLPGPVVGMALLLLALYSRRIREPVAACADALLAHLSLLFVPIAVGVMVYLPLLAEYGLRLLLVIVVSTWVGIAVHVWLIGAPALEQDQDQEQDQDDAGLR